MRTFAALSWQGVTGTADTIVYPHRTPILSVRSDELGMDLSPGAAHAVSAEHVRFAQQLADAAAAYATECERYLADPEGAAAPVEEGVA